MTGPVRRQPWRQFAVCAPLSDDTMYPDDDPHRVDTAKRVCKGCPVKVDCGVHAIEVREPWGVWGELTFVERERVRAGRPARPCAGCGIQFVPRLQGETDCGRCVADSIDGPPLILGGCGKGKLAVHEDDVRKWAAQGRTDRWIAATLQTSVKSVHEARTRWGIEPGFKSRKAFVDEEFRPHVLQEVIDGRSPFRILTLLERVEMWRRHAAAGGSMTAFSRLHRQSHATVRGLRDECARRGREQVSA